MKDKGKGNSNNNMMASGTFWGTLLWGFAHSHADVKAHGLALAHSHTDVKAHAHVLVNGLVHKR
jgi:hypothetical protein